MNIFTNAGKSGRPALAKVLVLTVFLGFFHVISFSQVSSSSITGSVHDMSNAIVVGADVVLASVDTNVTRKTVSNGAGSYSFLQVPPGHYTLTFSAHAFQTETISTFEVTVNQALTINASLAVGNVQQSVTVQAAGTQVEGSTAQLGTLMAQKQVNDLPLNGRNFTQLLQLTPGATPISVGQNSTGSNTALVAGSQFTFPSVNGQTNRSNYYLVDGMNDQNAWYNTYAVAPIIDTIQEFTINSHNDAQFGQVTGGVVNVATKSGTNSLHGSAWEYLRNNDFDARTYFPSLDSFHQSQFGGAAGGPILIPKLYDGRNRTFFFVAAEGWHYSQGNGTYLLVPTAAQLAGDFSSAACPNTGQNSTAACQLYNPATSSQSVRSPYPGNQIPTSQMDPHALAFIKAVMPAATVIPGISPTTYNAEITAPTKQSQYNYSARLDEDLGSKNIMFFRYSGEQLATSAPSTVPKLFSNNSLLAQQYGASWLHVFSPSTSLQVQYGRTHVEYDAVTAFQVPDITDIYGLASSYAQDYVGNVTLMPSLAITGYWAGGEVNSPASNLSSIHQWKGILNRTFGNHVFQAGASWDQINYTELLRQSTLTFSGAPTGNFAGNPDSTVPSSQASSQPGDGLAAFLLDYPTTPLKRNVNLTERPGGIMSVYVQDSWKTTQHLTVNYGLRYDRTVIPQYGTEGTVGQQGSIETGDFDFNTGNYIIQQLPPLCSDRGHAPCMPSSALPPHVLVALNQKILHGSKLNVGPRLGVAYRVNDGFVVRGGFGIMYDNWAASIQLPQNFQGSWPDVGTLQLDNTNSPGTPYTSGQNPFGNSSGLLPPSSPFTSSNVNAFVDPTIKNPYSEQWNLGIEKQFGASTILSLNYVGSESHRLDLGGYYNTGTPSSIPFATRQANGTTGQPFPYTVPNRWDHQGGNGTYNALQASLRHRYASGLAYQVAYTWSKAIDEGQSGWFGVEGNNLEDPYNPRGSRSATAYNVPQLFTVNVTYEIPFGNGKQFSSSHSLVNYVVGNWQLNSIFTARSGQNYTISATGDIANTGNGNTYERANLMGNPNLAHHTTAEWFNTSAFTTPAGGTLGDSGRNMLEAQTFWDLDTSLFRVFPATESTHFEFRAEAFNMLNHPVMGVPGAVVTTPSTFGQVTSVATGNAQRKLQLAVKFVF
jgi:hypothetical protein